MYVALATLAELPGARELAELASTEAGPVVDAVLMELTLRGEPRSGYDPGEIAAADAALARIEAAIAEADALIDGFLARRNYALPLLPVPGLVAAWSRAITRYILHKDRITDERTDPVARDYRDALRLLDLTAAGKFSLGADDPQADVGLGEVRFDSDPRRFDRRNSRSFR